MITVDLERVIRCYMNCQHELCFEILATFCQFFFCFFGLGGGGGGGVRGRRRGKGEGEWDSLDRETELSWTYIRIFGVLWY